MCLNLIVKLDVQYLIKELCLNLSKIKLKDKRRYHVPWLVGEKKSRDISFHV